MTAREPVGGARLTHPRQEVHGLEDQMATTDRNSTDTETTERKPQRKPLSRRAILKGSVVAMPAVLTLQSGAALARSSNLISATKTSATDAQGRTLCLDVDSVYSAGGSGQVYDLGEPAYAKVSAITDRDYWTFNGYRPERITEAQMCEQGGVFYARPDRYSWGGWEETKVPRGMLVSATALSSFATDIVLTEL